MTRRLAYPPAPLQGPPPGLLRPRSGQTARDAFGAGSGTDPGRPLPARHVRHRPGPVTRPSPAFQAGRKRPRPGGWLSTGVLGTCRSGLAPPLTDAASGTPMASASRSPPRHVSTPGPGHSLRLARNVRDPSGSGSAERVWHGGGGCGKSNKSIDIRSIGLSYLNHRTRKSTKLVSNKDEKNYITSRNKWMSFDFRDMIYLNRISVFCDGFGEFDEMELSAVDSFTGTETRRTARSSDGIFIFELKSFH
jgi:hypothetical protein